MPASRTFPRQAIAAALALLLSPASALCYDFTVGDLEYTIAPRSHTNVYVSGLANSSATNITIPPTVQNNSRTYRVTSIGNSAFYGCSGLTSVSIPNSVTNIESYAFEECSGLTNVTIGDSVTSIGFRAFSGCASALYDTNSIPGVRLVDGWAVGNQFPSGDLDLTGIRGIGYEAFSDCSGLTSVTIPDSVTSIAEGAFSCCSGLTSVTIPDSVTSIEFRAFYYCNGLASVTIGDSVTNIGWEAFSGCSGRNAFSVASGNPAFQSVSGLLLTKDGKTLFLGVNGDVVIPNSVTSIADYAFEDCSGLTSVTIPDSITNIGWYAFYDCSGLTSVTIPDSVTSIGGGAFSGCSGLNAFSVASGNPAFQSVSGLLLTKDGKTLLFGVNGDVVIPNSVTSIGDAAFAYCRSLTAVTIPDSVTSIEYRAFYGCSSLASVSIPDSVTRIGNYAFEECSGLTSVTIGDSLTSIGDSAFGRCWGLKTLSVPGAWEGTGIMDDLWGYFGKPEGCVVVYRKGGGDLLPEAGSEAEVAAVLTGAADGRLGERIRGVAEYEAFRAWVAAKGLDAAAVMGSAHAWISYALGAEGLFENEPEIVLSGVSVGRAGAKGEGSTVAVEVGVTVKDGGTAVAVDPSKVAGMFEATGDLRDWEGEVKIPATATPTESDGATMKFKVMPGDGTAQAAFLRIVP